MKLMKALIEINRDNGSTEYVGYPEVWLENKHRIPAILYPNDRTDDVVQDGKLYQPLFPVVPDDLVDAFISIGFEIADSDEALAFSEKHAPSKEIIEDERTVLMVVSKSVRGEALSQKEKDALDPSKSERGITMSKSFFETAKQYGCDNLK